MTGPAAARVAYADAAFCSGVREAKRLLRSPLVRLDCTAANNAGLP
ncbi:MAG TPA: hypothetical protein VMB74_00565 [Streptosporangiaceae bacterium]|nr:hypothetical protein [Streptosporangiaceae bacterium]